MDTTWQPHAPMTIKQALIYINEHHLVPFSRAERTSLAFDKWNSVTTITLLKLPFDPLSRGLCYLVCTERNVCFLLAKTSVPTDDGASARHELLVFSGENDGTSWRQLAVVRTLAEADVAIRELFAPLANHGRESCNAQG